MDRLERLEVLARLKGSTFAQAAVEEISALKREYEANLGRHLMESGQEVSQREIDYKRGYFRGMLWAYTVLVSDAAPKLDKLERELAKTKE